LIPADLPQVWKFFCDPSNLALITPPSLRFKVLYASSNDQIYPGQIIEYTVRPLAGVPLYWMTEITQVRDQEYFADEQRLGPYRLWHHQHHFRVIPGGVEMTDIVHYALPWDPLSRPFLPLVRQKLDDIFAFRTKKAEELWGSWTLKKS
jgi:ligand-binding SRPBCC domain-containing protein